MDIPVTHYRLAFCRLALGIVFALSFVGKVRNVRQFAQTMTQFRIIPSALNLPTAWCLLAAEGTMIALLLLGGSLLALGFGLALVLLLLFSIALTSVLRRRIRTTCNCFGARVADVSWADVWRNVGLAL